MQRLAASFISTRYLGLDTCLTATLMWQSLGMYLSTWMKWANTALFQFSLNKIKIVIFSLPLALMLQKYEHLLSVLHSCQWHNDCSLLMSKTNEEIFTRLGRYTKNSVGQGCFPWCVFIVLNTLAYSAQLGTLPYFTINDCIIIKITCTLLIPNNMWKESIFNTF